MNQQDLTAPVDRVRVSRREQFSRAYQILQDEQTERDISVYTFGAELLQGGRRITTLTETAGITRPQGSSIVITLNTIQMGELNPANYILYLFGERGGEREIFVQLQMEVVA